METIKVCYVLSLDEMMLINRTHMQHSALGRKVSGLNRIGGIIFISLGILSLCSIGTTRQKLVAFAFGVGFVLLGVVFLAGFPILMKQAVLKAYSKKPDRDLLITYQISEEGLGCKSDVASSDMLWRTIAKAVRTGEGFLLYLTGTQAHWLPIRGFQEPNDVHRFTDLVRTKVKDYKDES